jgi:hypothetical protein
MSKALGTDDSITSCDCCGRNNLKFTVTIELDNGEIAHYGQICARRNTGKEQGTITKEINEHKAKNIAAAKAEWNSHPANIAERAKYAERPKNLFGKAAKDFVISAVNIANEVRNELALKHNVSVSVFF